MKIITINILEDNLSINSSNTVFTQRSSNKKKINKDNENIDLA